MYIKARRILYKDPNLNEFSWLTEHIMEIDQDAKIVGFIPNSDFDAEVDIDYHNAEILPGLIDLHIHGCAGADTMQATPEAINTIANFLTKHGVVAFQATTVTETNENIEKALQQIQDCQTNPPNGAEIIGAYLEGPYFTKEHRGAHPEKLLQELDLAKIKNLVNKFKGVITTIALAPEKAHALEVIKYLKENEITVMLGHSSADYETTNQALDVGANGLVHCYNGMPSLHHRKPGMVGAGLTHKNNYIEIICDGIHVHPAAIDIVYRSVGKQKMLLITDAMEATGMPDGQYTLGEYQVTMLNGIVRTAEGSLAGSTLTLDKAVFNLTNWLNISLAEAWYMASYVPAKLAKIEDRLGSLAVGKQASFVVLADNKIIETWVNGRKFIAQ